MKEYDEFEPKYREMDPVTEKLLFDGSRLRNGMIVLPGSPERRVDISENMTDAELDRAREHNRWVLVTELVISAGNPGGISFIAVYSDHTERKISAPMFWPWLVKRDSIPADYDPSAPAKELDAIVLGKLEKNFAVIDDYQIQEGYEPSLKDQARIRLENALIEFKKPGWPHSDEEASVLSGSTEEVEEEHDEIFGEATKKLILEGSREECLEWIRKNRDLSEDVRVSPYDRDDLISGTQYLVIYG